MAKAIKHIKAGVLNVEIIGSIPEHRKGRHLRGRRANKTSLAQQFYNNKCSWRELELVLAANFGQGDMVVTFTYDDANLPTDKSAAGGKLQKFFRKLRGARRKRGDELKYIYTTEGFHEKRPGSCLEEDGLLEDKRIHHHVVMNSTGGNDLEEIKSLWQFGGYIRSEPLDIHYYQELAKYLTKEAREFGRPKPGERTWRASRNLTKYMVEYIEIPSDSVTLAPPYGAVDYASFYEKNPYGYADCIGARYLLFPEDPHRGQYSYAGRRERRPPSHNYES